MVTITEKSKSNINIGIGIIVLFIIFLTSYYNYLLFHSIAELFSILIAFSIFIIGWNSRRYMKNSYFLFLGIVYLFVGLLDLIHSLAYSGMGVFLEFDANLPTQLWIAARYLETLSLLVAIILINKKIDYRFLFLLYSIIITLLIGTIFYWRIFPTCYIVGVGLTSFKIYSEYVINVILFITILITIQKRNRFEHKIFIYLIISTISTIIAEMAFTFYVSVFGFSNLVGHIFKIISFYLVYKAIIETGIKKPYNLIFRDLKLHEEELLTYHAQLESLVEQRTIQVCEISFDNPREIKESINIQFDFNNKELFVLGNDLLEDVFDNILNNAIKHNRNPTVEIQINISKKSRERVKHLKLEFMDNGKGVSDTRKEIIFNRGNIEINSTQGMGLGLSVTKKIIESFQGEIWVEDRVNGDHLKGSNFILLIPEVN